MNEKTLLRFAIICSITGILVLIFISRSIETDTLKISQITENHIGQTIQTKGTITKITTTEELTILEIKDSSIIKIVSFEKLNLKKDQEILVKGMVKQYKDELEIEASLIKII